MDLSLHVLSNGVIMILSFILKTVKGNYGADGRIIFPATTFFKSVHVLISD